MKQQGVMVRFNQEDKSKSSETSNSQNEASIIRPAAIVKQTIVEYCAVIMLVCRNLAPFYCYCQLVVCLFKSVISNVGRTLHRKNLIFRGFDFVVVQSIF